MYYFPSSISFRVPTPWDIAHAQGKQNGGRKNSNNAGIMEYALWLMAHAYNYTSVPSVDSRGCPLWLRSFVQVVSQRGPQCLISRGPKCLDNENGLGLPSSTEQCQLQGQAGVAGSLGSEEEPEAWPLDPWHHVSLSLGDNLWWKCDMALVNP